MPGGLSGGDKVPAGRAQRNFSVQRGHAPHPLPPPVVIVCARGGPTATGGGRLFYTSHFKGGRWSPVATAHRRSPLPLRSVLDAPHRGAGPEAAAETEAPFGTPMGRKMSGEISFLVVGAFDGYPLRHDVIETGVESFFPRGLGPFGNLTLHVLLGTADGPLAERRPGWTA